MHATYWRRWKPLGFLLAAGSLYGVHLMLSRQDISSLTVGSLPFFASPADSTVSEYRSLSWDRDQCVEKFPNLTHDLDRAVSQGPFPLEPSGPQGHLQVRLKHGQLYILNVQNRPSLPTELKQAQAATLHQIHRAVITSPSRLPDTIFSINIHDQPFGTAWTYARPAYAAPTADQAPIGRIFLMPHFSFWAWPLPFIGSLPRAAAAIAKIEAAMPFDAKDSRVVWRGTMSYFGSHNPHLRQDLLAATKDAAWADVEALAWTSSNKTDTATNALMVEDFCRYKYVVYTEGITYSGRLHFLQLCRSILLTPPLAWLQHTTHLLKPLFAQDLPGMSRNAISPDVNEAWPDHYVPNEANAVFVSPNWSDLGDTIQWLEAHPDVARGIATRQRETFEGYLSAAAETCYWRALICAWASVVRINETDWQNVDETSWELFSVGN